MEKNVIIILIDAGRLDYALSSSVFNKLKPKSSFFSQSITYAPHTIAAMHAVFSGCFGNRTGTNSYWSTYKFKKSRFKTLTEYLHENGYHTECDLLNKLIVPRYGFDKFQIHDELNDNLVTRHSELVKKMVDISKEKNKKRYNKLFQDAEIYLDSILQVITQCGFDKNSLILVMSDHGISVGEKFGERAYGAFCYDYTIKTFAYYISSDFGSKEIPQQVRHIDFMPTILEQLNIGLDENFKPLDGVSLIPLINGESFDEKIAYTETANPLDANAPPKEPNTKSVRMSKWKLIYNEHNNTKELYNLEKDPAETNNLINSGLEIEEFLWNEFLRIQNGM